jgi:sugar phosphate isomerase/epimerase
MILLSTGSLYNYDLSRVFRLAAEIGYDGVEVMVDTRWDSRDPRQLKRLSRDYALPIQALHSPFVPGIQDWPGDQLGRLRRTVALAATLGVPVVTVHLPLRLCGAEGRFHGLGNRRFLIPLPWPRKEPFFHFLQDQGLSRMEETAHVRICLENMPMGRILGMPVNAYWFNHPEELLRFPHLTLDTTHLATWGMEPTAVYELLRERVCHVHLSNFDGREHRLPPDGHLSLSCLLRRLHADGYPGAVSVETDPDALDAGDEKRCRESLDRSLAFCREHYGVSSAEGGVERGGGGARAFKLGSRKKEVGP